MRRFVAVLAAGLFVASASAQVEVLRATDHCVLPVTAFEAPASAARTAFPSAPDCVPATEGAVFDVTYDGFPPGAEAAFQAAVDTWSCRVRSDQPIRVLATWDQLAPSTLGSAGPFLYRNFDGAPTRDVWYASALADALTGRDLGADRPDIEAFFNSDFDDWHFGPGPPPPGDYDLYTVVLHELAHGLGFIGAMTVEGSVGRIGDDPSGPFSYDLHTQTATGAPLLDSDRFPDGSVRLGAALQGEVRFVGRATDQVAGTSVPLYSPPQWVQGGSYSHLSEDVYRVNTADGLMTPFIARGETIAEPGDVVCAVIADVGWSLAGDCAARVGSLPAFDPTLTLERLGPNPTPGRTTIRISSEEAVSIEVRLLDVLGRRVAEYGTFVLVGGTARDVVVDGARMGGGVYFLSVRGGPEPALLPLTVVR
ncbi:hypothetical protein [Rubrivirga marina]|uniref:Secretion system C-terminal sorting domain-containing protein n=1 Tax=Rubrivirga marina TaxID=1196024 RepID=A0A271J1L3_9BACT|nr:hypothetical protein [Rubrivirga marina]PAP77197.1 hypothetical protein BSZ37_12530 [Rubrivirga marina]